MSPQTERRVSPPRNSQAVWSLPLARRTHPLVLVVLSLVILALDFLTGPHIHIAILFVFPVALTTWSHGRWWGSVVTAGHEGKRWTRGREHCYQAVQVSSHASAPGHQGTTTTAFVTVPRTGSNVVP
jgi:hypothetical protein